MQSEVALIPELAGHLIAGGGKRMRPMLTLACAACSTIRARATTGSPPRSSSSTPPPCSTTTSSTARACAAAGAPRTYLGQSGERPGRRFPLRRALRADGRGRQPQGAKILSRASAVIAEGEVDQLTTQRRIETGEDHYLEIIGAKTAALFAAACRIAAVVAERGEEVEQALDATAAISASPSSWSTMRSIMPPTPRRWARASATISATARSRFR